MSLIKDIGIGLAAGPGAGLVSHYWDDLNKKRTHTPYSNGNGLTADSVKLDTGLTEQLDPIAKQSKGRLASSLGTIRGRAASDATGASKAPGGYADTQIGMASARGNRNIDNGLYSVLGGGAYKDAQSQRENAQQMELAQMYGDLMSPTMLEEILGGASSVTGAAGTAKGVYDSFPKAASAGPYRDTGTGTSLYGQDQGISRYLGRSRNPFPDEPTYDYGSNWR